jgi:hypothetical protein
VLHPCTPHLPKDFPKRRVYFPFFPLTKTSIQANPTFWLRNLANIILEQRFHRSRPAL